MLRQSTRMESLLGGASYLLPSNGTEFVAPLTLINANGDPQAPGTKLHWLSIRGHFKYPSAFGLQPDKRRRQSRWLEADATGGGPPVASA